MLFNGAKLKNFTFAPWGDQRVFTVKFLSEKKIIIKQQSGFRANRQTKDNLIYITQKAHEAILKGNKLCAILFDIKGAFDKV